jgi:magnesium chelatase accessory protein
MTALSWDRDGADWPNRAASRFIEAGGVTWHVQQSGEGPSALLVHGNGASTHSWGWLAPHLEKRLRLITIDLPGHAFTSTVPSSRMTMPAMSSALGALLLKIGVAPVIAIGHSAGAAVLARMALDGHIAPRSLVSINGALTPFTGMAGHLFPIMAKMLFLNPFAPRFFTWRANRTGAIERLIEDTGSRIPPKSLAIYQRLFQSSDHVAGALAMMANWDLAALYRDLPDLRPELLQIIGCGDRAIPPDQAFQVVSHVPGAKVDLLRGVGHLAHEEAPDRVAASIWNGVALAEFAEGAV